MSIFNLSGLSGLEGLGDISIQHQEAIEANSLVIKQVLQKAEQQQTGGKYSFSQISQEYNKELSDDEIRAYVWFKQSIGFPMKGWEKYYLKGKRERSDLAYANKTTLIRDNHFRPLQTVEANTLLGKPTRFTNEVENGQIWRVVSMPDNAKVYVRDADLRIGKATVTFDQSEINNLVQKGALFYENSDYYPIAVYTFGNIYDKERQLREDREIIIELYGQEVYENHKRVLADAKPKMLSVRNDAINERPIITAVSSFSRQFHIKSVRAEYSDTENAQEFVKSNGNIRNQSLKKRIALDFDGEKEYPLIKVFKKWLYTLTTSDFEIPGTDGIDVVQYYLESSPLRNDKLTKAEKQAIKSNARAEGERLFQRFLHEVITEEEQRKLDLLWSSIYNAEADLNYHKVPIGFECSNTFKSQPLQFTPTQRQGIAFMDVANSGIIAYDVGVGKTMTAIITLANALYSGRAKRPLLIVPNPVYAKWIAEMFGKFNKQGELTSYGVLSGMDYGLNDWYNLGTGIVKDGKANGVRLDKPVKEGTITIVTYEGFSKMGFSDKAGTDILEELSKIVQQDDKEQSARDEAKKSLSLEDMLGRALVDTIADYDVLGFDFVVIDEMHNAKNVFGSVQKDDDDKKRYNLTGSVSTRAIRSFFMCNYIQRKFNGAVMGLTATPFENSPLEIYSMLAQVSYKSLVRQGINNINDFFDTFIIPETEWVVNVQGKMEEKEVIKRFVNRLILQKLIHNHILYKTGEDANVPRPCKVNLPRINATVNGQVQRLPANEQKLTYLNMNKLQADNQRSIVSKMTVGRMTFRSNTGKKMLLQALSESLNNAVSPFLYDSEPLGRIAKEENLELHEAFVKYSPKILYTALCIESKKKWHEDRKEPVSGSIIYLNRGKDFFHFIKQYLIEKLGFKKQVKYERKDDEGNVISRHKVSEVEIIQGGISAKQKEVLKDAFLDGAVKVLIGTATIREGVDLQKNGTDIFNCYPEWNPTIIKQLEGRIHRQGNRFGYVRSTMPLVADTMDVFIFQKLEEKSNRINDIWFKADRGNVLDLESLDPEEIKFALITDVSQIAKLLLEKEAAEHERSISVLSLEIDTIKSVKSNLRFYKRYRENAIEILVRIQSNLPAVIAKQEGIIKEAKTNAAMKTMGKKAKVEIKWLKEFSDRVNAYLNSSTRPDEELVIFKRSLRRYNKLAGYWETSGKADFTSFGEFMSKVKKAERTILKAKGFTLEDDIDKVASEMLAELKKLEDQRAYYKPDGERYQQLLREANQKKSALAIDGKTIEQRAEEYATLNYLLAFKYSRDITSCDLPEPSEAPKALPAPNETKGKKLKLLKLRAKAARARLKLLKLKQAS